MPAIIRASDNLNKPIVDKTNGILSRLYFNLLFLSKDEEYTNRIEGFESVYVVQSGKCDIEVDGQLFKSVGGRKNIWSGQADSVYAPTGASVKILAHTEPTEIAVAGGVCDKRYQPFRVTPDEIRMVNVGSSETHSHRRIFHILGHNAEGRAGNLLVSELLCEAGCWSGFPPHKHDEDTPAPGGGFEETGFEELYHYRFNPETGFGAQIVYQDDGTSQAWMTHDGDCVLIDKGYHPTITSPGHEEYIFTILVGHTQRSLIQNFQKEHRHLIDRIPGIGDMRKEFK